MTTATHAADVQLTLFERHIKQALKWYDDPARLGAESPLANPYFLGRALRDLPRPVTPQARGQVLCDQIRSAAARLWAGNLPATRDQMLAAIATIRRDPDDPRYSYIVLELRCFQRCIAPRRTSDIWEQPDLLPGSKSQHYREFDAAVKRLAPLLLDSLRPAVRAERPQAPAMLYGYEKQLAQVVQHLQAGRAVALSGSGGVGKTSVGAAATARLADRPVFWYTFRPGFNDGVSSLLFALGAFMHQYGAPNLWQYLVSANGMIGDLNLAAALLRQDLALLAGQAPTLCFDDMEMLSPGVLALPSVAQAQVFGLLEDLRGAAPLLLISQRSLPIGDLHLELTGLSVADITALCRDAGRELTVDEARQLQTYTGGNPRLLTLLLALRHGSDALIPEDAGAGQALSLTPAFQRLWRRLTSEERRALQRLSVHQGYAPEDVLDAATVESLTRLRLLTHDEEGGITLLPALGQIVRDDLSPELREMLHNEAAIARLERGEYTAAAYHFVQSKQEHRAVQVWFPQRDQAINRGEADAARQVFNDVSRQRLGGAERKALDIIRAELRKLSGQHEEGLFELEQNDWRDESEAGARLWMLRGELQDALGYPDRALESYSEGLQVTVRLLGQMAALHQRRGRLFQRRRDLRASWQEIQRAEFDLEVLRGLVREEEGAYQAALDAYRHAGELADILDDDGLRAQAERWIAAVHGRRQQIDEAVPHARRAIAIYERIGDWVNLEKMRSNLAFIYVQTRQFQAALEVGAPAYSFFVRVRDPYFAAVTGANLAEASFELGDYDAALRYASEVLELGDRFAAPYARFTMGQIDLACARPSAAVAHFAASMKMAQQNDDPYMVAYAQRSLGQAYLADQQMEEAEQNLLAALNLFQQLDIPGEVETTGQLVTDVIGRRSS